MPQLSTEARDLNWLVGNLAKHTPGVAHAMVVSADGLAVAVSDRLDRPKADQLAAIASGLASLTQGGARCMDGGLVKQTVVEMDRGLLVVMAISDGSCLTVLAASACDVGWSPTRRPCSSPAPVTSSPPASGPSSKPPSRHEHPPSPWRPSRIAGRRASCTGRKPTAAGPGRRDRPAR
jgi:predicted regulator of Ras-like GTPase activity (Roadblock/LC7/MglB family)